MELIKSRVRLTERDKVCLQFVVEQGFATIEQLWQVAWSSQKNASYTYNRIIELERGGYLRSVKIAGTTFKIVSGTTLARQAVANFVSFPVPVINASKDIAFHQLDLNDLRILFQARGLNNWRSAECLAVDPGFVKIGARHTPDAFYISSKGVRTALEYDRSLRKKDRIKERLSSYVAELMSPDRRIDRLIYLVAPAYLKTYQQIFDQSFSGIKGKFLLTTMDAIKKQITAVDNGAE